MTEFLIRIHSAILLITLEKPKKAGIRKAHFFKIVFEGYVAFRFSIVFLNFALGCPENTGTCQMQYTLSMYLLPFNLSRGPSISFSRDQEITFSLLIFFRAGQEVLIYRTPLYIAIQHRKSEEARCFVFPCLQVGVF